MLETANNAASWCQKPTIRGVFVKGHCSVQEIAKRRGISVRWVNQYALNGRIPGAEQLGRSWAIPEDAVKPKSTNPDLSQKKCQRETAGRNKQISTYRAFFFAGELANANRQDGTSGDQYELDRKIISEGMFHYYHAFPIAKGAKEGCNLMVRLMKEATPNAV